MRLSEVEARRFIETLLKRLVEIPLQKRESEYRTASALIGDRDPSDVEFVAVALKVRAVGIWSVDHDFDHIEGIPRLSTEDVSRLLDVGRWAGEDE